MKTKAAAKGAPPSGRSLTEFLLAKRREACAVCALPDDIRDQIASAREKRIERRVIREWLDEDCGIKVPDAAFTTHSNGHHDDR